MPDYTLIFLTSTFFRFLLVRPYISCTKQIFHTFYETILSFLASDNSSIFSKYHFLRYAILSFSFDMPFFHICHLAILSGHVRTISPFNIIIIEKNLAASFAILSFLARDHSLRHSIVSKVSPDHSFISSNRPFFHFSFHTLLSCVHVLHLIILSFLSSDHFPISFT